MSTADNNGEAMWEKFVSKYENIVLVLSGHVPSEDIVVSQDEGVNGNIVTSMLVDSQDVDAAEVAAGNTPLGAVAMLYFSEDGRDVQVEYYATARNAYYKENNQFGFELASVSKEVDDCERVVKEYTATEVADYLAKEGEDGYPKLDGYLFAGWYTDEDCDETSALAGKTPSGTTYALFVPKHMLSVKAQISANLIDSDETNNETGSIRFITTIDVLFVIAYDDLISINYFGDWRKAYWTTEYGTSEKRKQCKDEEDIEVIRQVVAYKGFEKGIHQVYMLLPKLTGQYFSIYRIRRLMNKYGIRTTIRRPSRNRKAMKELIARNKKANLLMRRFRMHRPNEVRLTDVTYLDYGDNQRAYGSATIDPVTGRLICFVISGNNDLKLASA